MKKIVVLVLLLILSGCFYLLYDVKQTNNYLKGSLENSKNQALEAESKKTVYESKQKELDELKKDSRVLKYNEVEAWNQEIVKYLD